jgi:hypothetical protein
MPKDRVEYLWELMIELREEILSRQKVRVQIYGFKIALLTLLFAYIGSTENARINALAMDKTGNSIFGVPILIILLPAIASVLLDFIMFNQDYGIKRISFFSREFLEPVIRKELKWPENELLWEEYMMHPNLRSRFGFLGNIGTTIIVYVLVLLIYSKYTSGGYITWANEAMPEKYLIISVLGLFFFIDICMIIVVKRAFGSQFKREFWSTYSKGDDYLIDNYFDEQNKADS